MSAKSSAANLKNLALQLNFYFFNKSLTREIRLFIITIFRKTNLRVITNKYLG